jgi:hypothetical protein
MVSARPKHNLEGGLLPSFNILGFTNLDVLDFWTGVAERAYRKDVRRGW